MTISLHATFDEHVDAAYIRFGGSPKGRLSQRVIEVPGKGDIVLDLDESGQLIGLEILGARDILPADVVGQMDAI